MDHRCTWPPYCTHCLCASLCLCISKCPCVFVSLYLSVIVFVFLFLCVGEQHLIPLPSIVTLGIHSSSLCLSAWSKSHFCLHFTIKTFQWKESISTPLAPTLVVELLSMTCHHEPAVYKLSLFEECGRNELQFTDIDWWCASLISKMSWVRRRLRKPIAHRLPGW